MSGTLHRRGTLPLAALSLLLATAPLSTRAAPTGAYPCEPGLVEIMFSSESRVRLRDDALVDLSTNAVDGLSGVLATLERPEWLRLCDLPEERIDAMQSRGAALSGHAVYNLNNIYRLRFGNADARTDPWRLCRDLEALPGVMSARPVPKPLPPPLPPDYQPSQNYEDPASSVPTGTDAEYAWTQPGGDGTGITVCDLEYSWNYAHNDLTKAPGSQINLNIVDPFSDDRHGTAVLGELVSDDNLPNWGTKGASFGAGILTCGTYYPAPSPAWNVPGAIALATANLGAGDIILLEQQWDYNGAGAYVPIEWWTDTSPFAQTFNAVYAAIANAVANGIHVVEAGGNGNVNTGLMTWFGDTGAVIVGAGGAYAGGPYPQGNLERLSFSSYGPRFDLQGWGENVVTTGYGTLYNAEGVNRHYTATFAGTSSASPIVAAAMASVQGYSLANISATPISPLAMRTLLVSTGTPQFFGLAGAIGPRPDCAAAIAALAGAARDDWGDAPEGVLAYPASGVFGNFPTCLSTGGAGSFVRHGTAAAGFFGPGRDNESDGNAGTCPGFAPYDADECFADGDAGLILPPAYTIDAAGNVVSCSGATGCLGAVCTYAQWGPNVDILVTNPGPGTSFVNVLMDWNQDGNWAGSSPCPSGSAPEHVLVNFPVPPSYSGQLAALGPPGFRIGPQSGYVWTRFTVSDATVPQGWNGAATFDGGESCDYLLCAGSLEMDYGDAPEGAPAYPWAGVTGSFPTCTAVGPAGYVAHASTGQLFFGPGLDVEADGNAGTCPSFLPYDLDECAAPDAGLLLPTAYTIQPALYPAPCPGAGAAPRGLGFVCAPVSWGIDVDIQVANTTPSAAFVNLLVDWDQNGQWGGAIPCPLGPVPEHVLVDFVVPAAFTGPLSALGPPSFMAGPQNGFAWIRFSVSDTPVGQGWTGAGMFQDGETCDYLVRIDPDVTGVVSSEPPITRTRIVSGGPNPFRDGTTIRTEIATGGTVQVEIFDVAGRSVRSLFRGERPAGRHEFAWDGRDAAGRQVSAGMYFVRLTVGDTATTYPIVRMR